MKRVACISSIKSVSEDAPRSFQVIELFNSTRNYNLEHAITGVFIVCKESILMVIEGESNTLGNVVFKVRNDSRLDQFSLIMNEDIDTPEFNSWGIKTLNRARDCNERIYEKLDTIFGSDFSVSSNADKVRLEKFLLKPAQNEERVVCFNEAKTKKEIEANCKDELISHDFHDKILSISSWPKPGKIKLCPDLIRICSRLVGRPHSFDDLAANKVVPSESILVGHLISLRQVGILHEHEDQQDSPLVANGSNLSVQKPQSSDRFGALLKNFLTSARH